MLDDLHFADRASLLLLGFLAAEIEQHRLLVIATYREEECTAGTALLECLGALPRHDAVVRVHLTGLTADAVGEYLAAATGRTPHPALVSWVHVRPTSDSSACQGAVGGSLGA